MKKLILISLLGLILAGCKDKCPTKADAWTEAQYAVKGALKSPSTADFPYNGTEILGDSEEENLPVCNFYVSGYVDAQNGFGAIVRNNYSLELDYTMSTKKWKYHGLSIK